MGHFCVYIDESGDEGFEFLGPRQGSSRWFVLSAVVTRSENDLATVRVVESIKKELGKDHKKPLHFVDLKHDQRKLCARRIGDSDLQTISVLLHKPTLPADYRRQCDRVYPAATGLLLDGVFHLCYHQRRENDEKPKIIFSNRSNMSYENLKKKIEIWSEKTPQRLRAPWQLFDLDRMRPIPHDQKMGLQLADAVASAFYAGVEQNRFGDTESSYVELLKKTVYADGGSTRDYGLVVACDRELLGPEHFPSWIDSLFPELPPQQMN